MADLESGLNRRPTGGETAVAASLMRMVPALLDHAGEVLAAARLQHAGDTLERQPTGAPTDADLALLASDRDAGRSDQSGKPS